MICTAYLFWVRTLIQMSCPDRGETSIYTLYLSLGEIESNKKLIFKKNFCFPKFPLFNPLASFDLNLLEKGWTKYFKNGLKSFHISHPSICTVYLFWGRTLIQMSSPDRGGGGDRDGGDGDGGDFCMAVLQWSSSKTLGSFGFHRHP